MATTKKQLAAGLKYSDAVAAQGGSSVNRQTGAVTTAPGYTAPKTTKSSGGEHVFEGGSASGNATPSAGDPAAMLPGSSGPAGVAPAVAPVTTSDPSAQAVDNLGMKIDKGLYNPPVSPMPGNPSGQFNPAFNPNTDPAVQREIQEGNKIYSDRQKELKKERDDAIKDLKVSMGIDKAQLGENQRKETGVTNRNLAYLQQGGQSASAMAYMNDLEMGHAREQANLTAKYNSAILQARTAYSEKDFQLADRMVENAQMIKKDAYARNQDFLDNQIKIQSFVMQQKKFQFDMEQAVFERQTEAKQFAIDNGIEQQFYDVGGIVYRTSDGQAFSTADEFVAAGGDPKFQNVYVVKPGSKEAKAYVYDLATKYVDAGIDPNSDDPATAQAKVKNSAIYREQVRPPSSGGGSGGGSGGLTAADYNLMLKMAPAAIPQLAKQGMGWAAIADHFVNQGIDPGSPDIDDALHRQFDTQENYRKYQQQTKYKAPVIDNNYNGIPDDQE